MKLFTLLIDGRTTISVESVTYAGFLSSLMRYDILSSNKVLWSWLLQDTRSKGGELIHRDIRAKLTVTKLTIRGF